jgi:hypothetical protein
MPLLRFSLLFLLLTPALLAQRPKYTSPPADASVTIGGKKISVEYYSPSMHGRKVMGGLVPYGQVWCTGANWATKLTTEADLVVGGLKLPKGSYSIWTLPNEKEWTLIINRETGQFHLNYDASRDLGRTRMAVGSVPAPVEAFRIELRRTVANSGKLVLLWENTEASVDFALQ